MLSWGVKHGSIDPQYSIFPPPPPPPPPPPSPPPLHSILAHLPILKCIGEFEFCSAERHPLTLMDRQRPGQLQRNLTGREGREEQGEKRGEIQGTRLHMLAY